MENIQENDIQTARKIWTARASLNYACTMYSGAAHATETKTRCAIFQFAGGLCLYDEDATVAIEIGVIVLFPQ